MGSKSRHLAPVIRRRRAPRPGLAANGALAPGIMRRFPTYRGQRCWRCALQRALEHLAWSATALEAEIAALADTVLGHPSPRPAAGLPPGDGGPAHRVERDFRRAFSWEAVDRNG